MPTVVATPGSATANSYLTVAEAQTYFDSRLPISEWDTAADQEALVIMSTRLMDAMFSPMRKLVRVSPPGTPYYVIRPTWTGTRADAVQALAWPRVGMLDRNGNVILSTVVPLALKEATAELAGQLAKGDRSFDSDASIQGLSSVKAGSVALTFKDGFDATKVIPDMVFSLLVPSWLTDEIIEYAGGDLIFEVL